MNNKLDEYFILFSNCVIVKGFKRSIICDTQRSNYEFIPNQLFEILQSDIKLYSINEIKAKYINDKETIVEYFNFLVEKEYGFFTKNKQNFPPISSEFSEPNCITNSIIDFDSNSTHDLDKIFGELKLTMCREIELRFFHNVVPSQLELILEKLNDSTIRDVNLLLPFSRKYSFKILETLILKFARLVSITFYGANIKPSISKIHNIDVLYTREWIKSEASCGQVSPAYFVFGLHNIFEAQNFNSCLYKKVSIDKNGEIKNCPSCKKSYGNHKINNIKSVVASKNYQAIGFITKDQIEVCKDCEFRYICQDCRGYTEDDNNPFSKPLKCNYDPYTATWL